MPTSDSDENMASLISAGRPRRELEGGGNVGEDS